MLEVKVTLKVVCGLSLQGILLIKIATQWHLEWFERRIGPLLPTPDQLGVHKN